MKRLRSDPKTSKLFEELEQKTDGLLEQGRPQLKEEVREDLEEAKKEFVERVTRGKGEESSHG